MCVCVCQSCIGPPSLHPVTWSCPRPLGGSLPNLSVHQAPLPQTKKGAAWRPPKEGHVFKFGCGVGVFVAPLFRSFFSGSNFFAAFECFAMLQRCAYGGIT